MLALNRSAIVLRPKPPFLEWLHAADLQSVSLTLADLGREPTIYLVSACEDAEDEQACLQTVFSTMFDDQLDGWWRDRTAWPTPRSFDVFTRWFDYQFLSTLLDLTDEPLIEEEIRTPAGPCRSNFRTLRRPGAASHGYYAQIATPHGPRRRRRCPDTPRPPCVRIRSA